MANTNSTHSLTIKINATGDTKQVSNTASEMDRLTKKTQEQNSTADKAPSIWGRFGSSASGALKTVGGGLQNAGGAMSNFGNKHKVLTAGIVAGGVKLIASSNEYNKTLKQTVIMSDDQELASMSSAEAMKFLDGTITELRGNFKTFSKQQIADQFYEIAKSGYSGKDATDLLSASLMLASATGEDVSTMTDVMVSTLTSFSLGADKSADSAQSLANAANASRMDVSDMLTALNLVGKQASEAGLSLEETANIIGFLRQNGMNASTASTGLRTAISNLQKPTKGVADVMERLNLSAYDSDGNFRNLNDILAEYKEKTKDATQEQRDMDAQMIAGKTGATAWTTLVSDSGQTLEEFSQKVADGAMSLEEMQAELDAQDKWGQFKANMEDSAITLAQNFAPMLQLALDFLNDFLERVNSDPEFANQVAQIGKAIGAFALFSQAVGVIGSVVTIFGGVLSALGTVIGFVTGLFGTIAGAIASAGGIMGIVSTAGTALGTVFTVLTGPIGLVIAIIGGLVFAFKTAYEGSEEFRDKVNGAVKKVLDFISPVTDWIKDKFDQLSEKFEWVGKIFDKVGGFMSDTWGAIKGVFKGGSESASKAMGNMEKNTTTSTDGMNKEVTADVKAMEAEIAKSTALAEQTGTANLDEMAKNASKSTNNASSNVGKDMKSLEKSMTTSTKGGSDNVGKDMKKMESEINKSTKSAKDKGLSNIKSMTDGITKNVAKLPQAMANAGRSMVTTWRSSLSSIQSSVSSISYVPNQIKSILSFSLYQEGQNAMISFGNGLASGLSHVYTMVSNASSASRNMSYSGVYGVVADDEQLLSGMTLSPIASAFTATKDTLSNLGGNQGSSGGSSDESTPVSITIIQKWDGKEVKNYIQDETAKDKVRVRTIKKK